MDPSLNEYSSGGSDRRSCVYLDLPVQMHSGLSDRLALALEQAGLQVFSSHCQPASPLAGPGSDPVASTRREFNWMETCDVFVTLLPRDSSGRLVRAEAAHMRLGWAGALKKRVVVVGDGLPGPDAPLLLRGITALTRTDFLGLSEVLERPGQLARLVRTVLSQRPGAGYVPYSAQAEQAMLGCVS